MPDANSLLRGLFVHQGITAIVKSNLRFADLAAKERLIGMMKDGQLPSAPLPGEKRG